MSNVNMPNELLNLASATKTKQGDKRVKMLHEFKT